MANIEDRQGPSRRPNIILMMADDMGFSDLGCYGSEIQTPNLNEMAAKGQRYSQMYNYARCCPTRAALLTGLYPHQAGIGHMVSNLAWPGYQGYLRDDCVIIAEVLRAAGYRTLMSGKWHVGGQYELARPETWQPGTKGYPTPRQRGFDRFYGTLVGAGSYFRPHALMENDSFIEPEGDDFYYTDAISDHAVTMIEDARTEDAPFFLYVAYTAPHWPLHAFEEDIARYEGQYRRGGWDGLRTHRHEELNGMGILDSRWAISPRDETAPDWDDVKNKHWEDLRMAVYAAQIDRMDQGIGRILSKLRELEIEENTLVMFLADNGGCAEFLREDGPVERYASLPAPDGSPLQVGNRANMRPGAATTFMSYDLPWANASNAPFRLYKHWVHEGGISTPFIAHWPGVIEQKSIVHTSCHIIDIMATCAEIGGATYPAEYGDNAITPLEGESLWPAMAGEDWRRERPLFWEHEGNRAVRRGEWKLVSKHPGPWELYRMVEDRTELNDLVDRNRPIADELARLYAEWAQRCGVLDWPLPKSP